jgi:adenylylsulfate kinase-like enzyme
VHTSWNWKDIYHKAEVGVIKEFDGIYDPQKGPRLSTFNFSPTKQIIRP